MWATARSAWVMACTSGWFWQEVPRRFHTKAIASSRRQSTPRLARNRMMSANSVKTSGLDQSRSHCQELNVVQTQPSRSSSQVKLPGANAGKTSGRKKTDAAPAKTSRGRKKAVQPGAVPGGNEREG